jgi:hypothetical protein
VRAASALGWTKQDEPLRPRAGEASGLVRPALQATMPKDPGHGLDSAHALFKPFLFPFYLIISEIVSNFGI